MRGVYIGCDWLALSGRADLAWCFFGVSTFPWFGRLWFRFSGMGFGDGFWCLLIRGMIRDRLQ